MTQKELAQLAKYDKLLQEYADKVMPRFEVSMDRQRQPYKSFYKKLFDYYLLTSYLTDSKLFPDDGGFPGLRILYAKSCHSLFGIYSCIKNGVPSEGGVILRSLFETMLNVKLILEDNSKERDNLFYEFHFVEKWNNLEGKRLLLEKKLISEKDFKSDYSNGELAQITKDYNRIKQNYHPKYPHQWAWKLFQSELKGKNPKVKFIADILGLAEDYVRVYGALSLSSHGSPNLKNVLTGSRGISTAPIFSNLICTVGCLAVGYMGNIMKDLSSFLKFDNGEEFSMYVNASKLTIFDEYNKLKNTRATASNTG